MCLRERWVLVQRELEADPGTQLSVGNGAAARVFVQPRLRPGAL